VDGQADVAVTNRIRSSWLKFRSVTDVSLLPQGEFMTCVWSCMSYESE